MNLFITIFPLNSLGITADIHLNEYLVASTSGRNVLPLELKQALMNEIEIDGSEDELKNHPLANWIEVNIALRRNEGVLERAIPLSIESISEKIQLETDVEKDIIHKRVVELLKWIERVNANNRANGIFRTYLPYRFHQFMILLPEECVPSWEAMNRS